MLIVQLVTRRSPAVAAFWKIERDGHMLQDDAEDLSECLSSIFCAADMYGRNDSRTVYKLDGEMLKLEVSRLIKNLIWS